MKKLVTALLIGVLSIGLMSCTGPNRNQNAGTLLGAGIGGLLGNQFGGGSGKILTTFGGALLGGFIGNQVGKSMDQSEKNAAYIDTQKALENNRVGHASVWRNPDANRPVQSITVKPTRTYKQSGEYCREFQQTIVIGGESKEGYGKACRQPDGTWKIVG